MAAMQPKLTVYYNRKCPVCNAGITWQKRRLIVAARTRAIDFRDINLEPEAMAGFGASLDDVRRRLHGVDAEGRAYRGIDCVAAIWRRAPGTIWLSRTLALPVIRQVAGFTYDRFADVLFAWNRRRGHW
jgi:predicted DCC family thiol-disulfide oxidoreductase YuxK